MFGDQRTQLGGAQLEFERVRPVGGAGGLDGAVEQPDGLGVRVQALRGVGRPAVPPDRLDGFAALQKDPQIYPKYGSAVAVDAQEQTLRTLTDLLVTHDGDYRDIFTTRKTYLTRLLGSVYAVPVKVATGWEAHEYPEGDPRSGILTEVSFVALHSHPGRSSPTLRPRNRPSK